MANKKLSQLPVVTQVLDADEMYINQDDISKKHTVQKLKGIFTSGRVLNPLLSGVTEASDASQIDITIDNYNTALTYDITVSVGTTSLTNGVITWTIPVLTADALHTIWVESSLENILIPSEMILHEINIYKDWRYRVVSSADPFKNGGLIAKYEMKSDMSDTTGNFSGTNPFNLQVVPGKFGNVLQQVNTNIGVKTGTWPAMTTFSISLWIFYVDNYSLGASCLYSGAAWNNFSIHSWQDVSLGNFHVGTNQYTRLTTTDAPLIQGWNHIVVTIDETEMKVYVNSAVPYIKTVAVSGNFTDLSFNMVNSTNVVIEENMDQIEVYNYILDAEEVDVLFNQNELTPQF